MVGPATIAKLLVANTVCWWAGSNFAVIVVAVVTVDDVVTYTQCIVCFADFIIIKRRNRRLAFLLP